MTAGAALGSVSADAGMPALTGAVLTVAGHDHQAAAIGAGTIGAGTIGAGDELDSCGTAEARVRTIPAGLRTGPVREMSAAGVTVGWHALPGYWCLLGATESGLDMQRFLDEEGVGREEMPALDSPARRAVLARGQQQARALRDAMTAAASGHGKLIAVGGWLRSPAYVAVKERFFGPLLRPMVEEAGARGAALTAGVAAGVYPDFRALPAPGYQ